MTDLPTDLPAPVTRPAWQTHEFWSKNITQIVILGSAAYAVYSGHGLSSEQQTSVLKTAGTLLTSVEGIYHFARSIKTKGGTQ